MDPGIKTPHQKIIRAIYSLYICEDLAANIKLSKIICFLSYFIILVLPSLLMRNLNFRSCKNNIKSFSNEFKRTI